MLTLLYRVEKKLYQPGSARFERAAQDFAKGSTNLRGSFYCGFIPVGGGGGLPN